MAKNYIVPDYLIRELTKLNLSYQEFLMIIYFWNEENKILDLEKIGNITNLTEKDILEAFNNLCSKNLLTMDVQTLENGKVSETISLNGLYDIINQNYFQKEKEETKETVFDIFEKEFDRQLSPIEYEIVNAWLDNNISEELILGALKEAIYNGVKNFRYIDKIIYEWGKKGFKTMDDVNAYLKNREDLPKPKTELFDYNWLDDDEV